MKSAVVCVCLIVCVESGANWVYDTTSRTGSEENDACRREGSRVWLCKQAAECSSFRTILKDGGRIQTCSWKNANTHIICCPPETESVRQTFTESVTVTKCAEYQNLLCGNGVYRGPLLRLAQNGGEPERQTGELVDMDETKTMSPNHFVYGGKRAYAKTPPHMALVGYGDATDITWQCGGSLISERFVLSAAHCSDTSHGLAGWVRLGDLALGTLTEDARFQQFEIVERVVHRGFSAPAYYNDIVLFRLDRQVVFDEYVGPACLHSIVEDLEGNGIAIGWGRNETHGPRSAGLMEVTLGFVPIEECKTAVDTVGRCLPQGLDDQTMLCAGEQGKDTCLGYSGGPLMLEAKGDGCLATQVGVTSFCPRFCGVTDTPGIFVRVAYFLPWIESVVWPKP